MYLYLVSDCWIVVAENDEEFIQKWKEHEHEGASWEFFHNKKLSEDKQRTFLGEFTSTYTIYNGSSWTAKRDVSRFNLEYKGKLSPLHISTILTNISNLANKRSDWEK